MAFLGWNQNRLRIQVSSTSQLCHMVWVLNRPLHRRLKALGFSCVNVATVDAILNVFSHPAMVRRDYWHAALLCFVDHKW